MIPKIIHYCWFGRNPLPPLAIKCIESWKKLMPDYEIKEWNEDNFDINMIPYTKEAYQSKKYAFVSDYARFWILYHYGGIYFDTDVELIKPIYDIVDKGPFWGCEGSSHKKGKIAIAPGLGIGCIAHHPIYEELLNYYSTLHFINSDNSINYTTIVQYTTDIMKRHGWEQENKVQQVDDMFVYSIDYFSPIDIITKKIEKTSNTRSIHWYTASWKKTSKIKKIKNLIKKYIPTTLQLFYNKYISSYYETKY